MSDFSLPLVRQAINGNYQCVGVLIVRCAADSVSLLRIVLANTLALDGLVEGEVRGLFPDWP